MDYYTSVYVILRQGMVLAAVAEDHNAAMRWIQDEVDGKHEDSGHSYMRGKSAIWWLEYGTFRLKEVPLYV